MANKFVRKRADWKCCFCCHVRTATLFLGIWHLVLHQLALSVMAVALLPTPLSRELANIYPNISECLEHMNVSIAVTLSAWLMVCGVIKEKPFYLIPFIWLQLVYLCFSSWAALTFLYNLPKAHGLVAESTFIPMYPESLTTLIILFTDMLVKAYFIQVVWSCYKNLSLRPAQPPPHRT